jgi:chloramphenicol 3-O phosphotransferase
MDGVAKIIFLHGASSSGKSTIARAIQERIDEPFWHISIDHLRDSGVLPSTRFKSGEFQWRDSRSRFFGGFHLSLAAYASAGNNLILEHILDTDGWLDELVALLKPFDVFFVGVHCSLPELQRREAARGDRPAGSAEMDFNTIHHDMRYDFEIQSEDGVEANVDRILAAWKARQSLSAFARLALKHHP